MYIIHEKKYKNSYNNKKYVKKNAIFVKSKNSKTSNSHRLLLNVSDQINLKRSDKYVALSILVYIIHGKI